MTWLGNDNRRGEAVGAIAGVAVTAAAAAAANRPVALARPQQRRRRAGSLTVDLPPPVNDRIYASPAARGGRSS